MPFYHKLGQIPHKRHVQYRKPDGGLYREELIGLEGFSSLQSILYHHFLPPRIVKSEDLGPRKPEVVEFGPIQHRAFKAAQAPLAGDPLSARHVPPGPRQLGLGGGELFLSPDPIEDRHPHRVSKRVLSPVVGRLVWEEQGWVFSCTQWCRPDRVSSCRRSLSHG